MQILIKNKYWRMLLFLGILTVLLPVPMFSVAQSRYSSLVEIDNLIEQADSLSNKSQRTFSLNKYVDNDRTYKETWHYSEKGGKVVVFQVNYTVDSMDFTEVYYLHRGKLICSEEYETINYSTFEDELKWGGVYLFESAVVKHSVTIGRRAEDKQRRNPEVTALLRFQQRLSELQRHIPMLP